MNQIADNYDVYYADKLWNLLPAVYRALDTDNYALNADDENSDGPLREMVNRIGAQAAILRRSIDRLWEDQSIETCDDWLIPYVGQLLATNLVAKLNPRAQRLDVANTINYRRRKGTLGLLEQLSFDITGWNARVIEFFRRMGRTRHLLDPQIGQPVAAGDDVDVLQQAQGLVGTLTRTPIGGTADLRNAHGAANIGTAFDEFFHTADFRYGQGKVGWHNIPRMGVFLWRLRSYGVPPTTPVAVSSCPGWCTFDPTGRDMPLFAAARESESYGSAWISPIEAQLPGSISQGLYQANANASGAAAVVKLYPDSLAVWPEPVSQTELDFVPQGNIQVWPERGRFQYIGLPPIVSPSSNLWGTYHYGFSSEIGAGPYDRRLVRPALTVSAQSSTISGGGDGLKTAGVMPANGGTLTIDDSLTYNGASDFTATAAVTICSNNEQRPLIRFPADGTAWAINGSSGSSLVLDGLFISGGDLILTGSFDSVTISCCTFDPGTVDPLSTSPPSGFAMSSDGQLLSPTRLWIEAEIQTLTIGYSITGPVQTRKGGTVQTLCINNSILQAIPGSASGGDSITLSPPALAADAALLLEDGDVNLSRCTVLGEVIVHRLSASECILQDVATVDDTQHGCVRFSAWAKGSSLPSQYESVEIPAQASIFASTEFGRPDYCQLLATADLEMITDPNAATQNTISAGSQDGSEMGVFAREQNPVKERGLLVKFAEYMPAGLVPVLVYVT